MKICLVGSSGGHLAHLYMLQPIWGNNEHFWVTFPKEDAKSLLKGQKTYLTKERPDLIISSGAAVAVPFFYVGKLLRAKTIYIEVFDRMDKSTLTGRLVHPVTDRFIVQWEEMKKVYKHAINLGSIF